MSSSETERNEDQGTIVDQMKKELFFLAESIHEASNEDSVIIMGIMDKESATVTKWANCSDLPIIEHLINELGGNRARSIESMSSNASMNTGNSSRSQLTNRKADMGCQTVLSHKDIQRMEVNSLILREQFQQMKEKVDTIIKKDGIQKIQKVEKVQKATGSIQIQQPNTPIKARSYFRSKGEVTNDSTYDSQSNHQDQINLKINNFVDE